MTADRSMCFRALVCGVALLLTGAAWATHSQGEPLPDGQGFHLPESNAAPSTPSASSASSSSSNGLDVLKRLTQGLAGSQEQAEFLPPDVAFVLSADAVDADTVVADWQIADGYYLYRSKMRFDVSDPEGFAIGDPVLPAGKTKIDEYFGEMEVYYEGVQATLPLQRGDSAARSGIATAGTAEEAALSPARGVRLCAVMTGGLRLRTNANSNNVTSENIP